jgi:hypothetical protein
MEALGYWQYITYWTLLPSQNAGTGTVAYSAGGGGIYDGTLTAGASWGADGLYTEGGGMTMPVCYKDYSSSTFFIQKPTALNDSIAVMMTNGDNNDGFNDMTQGWINNESNISYSTLYRSFGEGLPIPQDVYSACGANLINDSSLITWVNGVIQIQGGSNCDPSALETLISALGQSTNGDYIYTGYFPFALIARGVVINYDSVYALYKSTLGSSLVLP